MAKQLLLRPEKCTNCRTCELVCSFHHFGKFNPTLSAVAVIDFAEDVVSVPLMCLQCDDPACEKVCSVGAITVQADGKVVFNEDKCILCKLCVQACPMGNISYSTLARKLIRCDLCGSDPQCAAWCHTKAIVYADAADDFERRRAVAGGFKDILKEAKDEAIEEVA
jgi:Fe-S-cluster-containing hydrogenase component 2